MDEPEKVPRSLDDTFVSEPAPAGNPFPAQIGRYAIKKLLAQNGFARFYLARDDVLGRLVTIKHIPHHRFLGQAQAEVLLKEARVLAALEHRHIIPLLDVLSDREQSCALVFRFVETVTLQQILRESRPSVIFSARLLATVADTAHYVHSRGYIHRNIKHGNILIDDAGKPYLSDFELACRADNQDTGQYIVGTPLFMSPEQALGDHVDARSDVFSLGIVFYEMLTGRLPFREDSSIELLKKITKDAPVPPRQIDSDIPPELERICLKALAKRPSERFTTAHDFAVALKDCAV